MTKEGLLNKEEIECANAWSKEWLEVFEAHWYLEDLRKVFDEELTVEYAGNTIQGLITHIETLTADARELRNFGRHWQDCSGDVAGIACCCGWQKALKNTEYLEE